LNISHSKINLLLPAWSQIQKLDRICRQPDQILYFVAGRFQKVEKKHSSLVLSSDSSWYCCCSWQYRVRYQILLLIRMKWHLLFDLSTLEDCFRDRMRCPDVCLCSRQAMFVGNLPVWDSVKGQKGLELPSRLSCWSDELSSLLSEGLLIYFDGGLSSRSLL